MSGENFTPESFGRLVLGPIVADFFIRLWSFGSTFETPTNAAMLFCSRGGLRMLAGYERFLSSTGLTPPVTVAPLMVSRVSAIRPALARTVTEELRDLVPSVAATLRYEFAKQPLNQTLKALTGVAPLNDQKRWSEPTTPAGLTELLRHPDAEPAVAELLTQAALFERHVRENLGNASLAILVDTGLYGTTGQLLTEAFPDLSFSTALIAHTYRPALGATPVPTFGLSVQGDGYSMWHRRSVIFRYWHFIEWLFEPDLPSVRSFREVDGKPQSNLEDVPNWNDRILGDKDSPFAGVLAYLDSLTETSIPQVLSEADSAWDRYRRALIWPTGRDAFCLQVGSRSHDFGREETWTARQWRGPIAVLKGSTMWREGEIARSGTALRWPLLAGIETAYRARQAKRSLMRRLAD